MSVIQHSVDIVLEHSPRTGAVDTVIGCVVVDGAVLNVTVSGECIDLSLASALEDEERHLAAENALAGQAHAHLDLDGEDAEGLVRLLRQAIEVRGRGMRLGRHDRATDRGSRRPWPGGASGEAS